MFGPFHPAEIGPFSPALNGPFRPALTSAFYVIQAEANCWIIKTPVITGKNELEKENQQMSSKKVLLTVLSVVLVAAMAIGGTLAYLQSTSEAKTNTFQKNEVTVEIGETDSTYNIIPGFTQTKDPVATVKASVDSYVFLTVTEGNEVATYVDYAVDPDVWGNSFTDNSGTKVYYTTVAAFNNPYALNILKDV